MSYEEAVKRDRQKLAEKIKIIINDLEKFDDACDIQSKRAYRNPVVGALVSLRSLIRELERPYILYNKSSEIDYDLCNCSICPLFGKHCKGRCWEDSS